MTYDESPKQAPTPGTTPTAAAPTATDLALIPPRTPTTAAPEAFRLPCPACGAAVVFPFDPVLSAKIDQLLFLEEQYPALEARAAQEVTP